jgi:hypothetical protein
MPRISTISRVARLVIDDTNAKGFARETTLFANTLPTTMTDFFVLDDSPAGIGLSLSLASVNVRRATNALWCR